VIKSRTPDRERGRRLVAALHLMKRTAYIHGNLGDLFPFSLSRHFDTIIGEVQS
jgi:hypothetical protein